MRATSGPLEYSDVKGLHHVDARWWIDTYIADRAFRLLPYGSGESTSMDEHGRLCVMPGFLWDGSSGPTLDGEADPVPSLVHDVLYEAMRARRAPMSLRPKADALYRKLLEDRGMGFFRRWWRYLGLRLVGRFAASPRNGPEYPRRSAA